MSALCSGPQNDIFMSPFEDRKPHAVCVEVQRDTTYARQVPARELYNWLEDMATLSGVEPATATQLN